MKTQNTKPLAVPLLIFALSSCWVMADAPVEDAEKDKDLSESVRSLGIVIRTGGDKGAALMERIARRFPKLEELQIKYGPYGSVPDAVVDNIVKLGSLKSLSFTGDMILKPEQLSRIVKKPNLRHLSFACPCMKKEAVVRLATSGEAGHLESLTDDGEPIPVRDAEQPGEKKSATSSGDSE